MTALLPVLDDFDRAKKSAEAADTEEQFSEGVELVYQKLYKILEAKGLKAMESTGEVFDPEMHSAITEIPAPSEDMKGKVFDTVEKGYFLKDKIIEGCLECLSIDTKMDELFYKQINSLNK